MLRANELVTDVIDNAKGKPISFEYGNGFFQLDEGDAFSILELSFSEIVSGNLQVGDAIFEKNSKTGNELFVVSVSIKKFIHITAVFAVSGSLFGKIKSEQKLVQSIKELSKMKVETEEEKHAKFTALLEVFSKNGIAWMVLDQKDSAVRENAAYLEDTLSTFPAPVFLFKRKNEEPKIETVSAEVAPTAGDFAESPAVMESMAEENAAVPVEETTQEIRIEEKAEKEPEPIVERDSEPKVRRELSASTKERLIVFAFNLVFVFLAVLCSFLMVESFSGSDAVKGVIVAIVLAISISMYLYNISFVTRMSPIVKAKDFKLFQAEISIVGIISATLASLVLYLFGQNKILFTFENIMPASFILSTAVAFILVVLPFFSEGIAILFFKVKKLFSKKD